MKNFNQLVNESSGLKLTRDYSRFLLEQQAFVAKKTCAILFGEETDYDGSDDKSNDPPFTSHLSGQFYVHINLDGRRKIKTANTAQEAALLTKDYPGSVIYNFKGDEVDPNQVKMTESVERFNIFEDEAYDYTKSESKKRAPEDESGILNSIANAWRSKEKGAAVAMANNNSFIARNLQNLQNALTGIGAFGADRTPEQTMQERDDEVKKLRDKLDAYEMEQRGKGFRNVEDIPLSDEETKDVQTFIKQRQEQQDRVGPMMPGVAERVVGLPREQLKAYKDFYKTATAYQGKALQDYYDQNPDKYSAHEPYMDTKTAVALKPISRSEDEGSSMPGRLKGTSFDSAAKVVAGLPETAAMLAAGIVAPELVGGLVGGAGRIVPAIARVSSGAAAKAATAQAINTAVGLAGVDKLANAKDVVQGAEGAVMAAAIGDPLFKSTSPNPAAHKNAIDLWNAKLKAERTSTLAGQKGAYETSAMIRREVPTGAKEGAKRTGPRGEYPKVAETPSTTEWPGVNTNPRTIETGGKASETAGQVANEEIPLLLRNLETRAWRDYETFDPAVVRQAARDRVAGRLGSGQPEVPGTRPSVPSENPPAARETVPLRLTDTGTYKEREKERNKAENKEKERIETEMRKGRVNPEQTSSRPSFADTVDALKGTVQKAGTELVNWMKPKPGTSVQRRALTPSSELALYPKRTASEVLADTKYSSNKQLDIFRQAAKDISTGVKERGAAETAAQLAAVATQAAPAVMPDLATPPAIRASAPDVWKPSSNMDLMTSPEPIKAPRATANPEPIGVTPKGEVIKVTPESTPVNRAAIDSFVKSLLPSAANRTTSTQPANNVPPPTTAPASTSDTPTTAVPSTVTDTTTTPTTAPAPTTSSTTATTTTQAPVTAPTIAPAEAPATAPVDTPDTAPVADPIVNKIVNTLIAAAAIGGGSKLLPGKKGGGGGGGGGSGGGLGGGSGEREEIKRQQQELDSKAKNWDLLIKNIWGKNVETLTK